MDSKIPARTLPAYMRNFCVFNRIDFVDLLNHINDVLKEEFEENFVFEISISGFDFPFATPETVTEVLTKDEWKKLKLVEIKLFKESAKNHPVVEIQLGGTVQPRSNSNKQSQQTIAFKCVVKSGTTSQKVATKERIRLLTEDYARKPINILLAGLIFSTACYLLAIVINAIIRYRLEYVALSDSIQRNIIILPIFAFIISCIIHALLFPSIEFIEESGKTRWQKVNGHFYSILAMVGLILAILSFLPSNK